MTWGSYSEAVYEYSPKTYKQDVQQTLCTEAVYKYSSRTYKQGVQQTLHPEAIC